MKKWFGIHPLLFAIFPILFLFSHNIKEMSFGDTIRPIVIVVSFTFLLWLLLIVIIRDMRKAAIVTSIFLLLFFSYGHLWGFITDILSEIAYFRYLLFENFPIFYLLSPGIKEMSFREIVLSTAVVASFTLLLWILVNSFVKKRRKSAIITIIVLLVIFCYGHLINLVLGILLYSRSREIHFVLLLASIFAANTFLVIKTGRKLHGLTNYLNIVSILLVAFPMITIVVHRLGSRGYRLRERQLGTVNLEKSDKLPDIYYIILDGYARADILEELYQYDNSEFLKYLAQKGFFVAHKSRSNYAQTGLSLASSLNLTYLEDLAEQMGPESDNQTPLKDMIKNNEVANFLKQNGYLFMAFSTGVRQSEIGGNADIHIFPKGALSEFENLLLNSTPIPLLLNKLPEKSQHHLHRERLLYAFEHLADPAKLDAPVFVFAHIMAPHPPFVFGENGEKIESNKKFSFADGTVVMDKDEYVEGYRNQVIFINKKMKAAIDEIMSKSPEPPIIILQADHGPALYCTRLDRVTYHKEKMSIFNAYYLPGSGHKKLYNEITPVNTFRMIFNHYFGTDLELLEDKSYYSEYVYPYEFIDVTDETNTD